jgi:hypothetical protein
MSGIDPDAIINKLSQIGNNPVAIERLVSQLLNTVQKRMAGPLIGIASCIVLMIVSNIVAMLSASHAYRMTSKIEAKTYTDLSKTDTATKKALDQELSKIASAHTASGVAWGSILFVGIAATVGIAGCTYKLYDESKRILKRLQK